jgi:hypothetical protein
MPRLILQDAYDARVLTANGECSGTTRGLAWIDEAQRRLLSKGLWWGTYAKYRMAAYGGLISMPPQLSTIETVAVNHAPIPPHDMWFEFLENGFGTRSRDQVGSSGGTALGGTTGAYGIPEANYRGSFCTFRDLTPNTNAKKLVLVCDLAADHTAGITATILGHDANGNWVRTVQSGVYADGEVIALAQSPGSTSVSTFSDITGIQFSAQRSGQCWLYQLDTGTGVSTLIGWYQWFETNPSYGRWLFPSISSPATGVTPPANWQQTWTQGQITAPASGSLYIPSLVEVVGKVAFIPAVLPTDYLVIGNLTALKLEVACIKKQEDAVSQSDLAEAVGFETLAIRELDDELDTMLGSGRKMGLNIQGPMMADGCAIQTFI